MEVDKDICGISAVKKIIIASSGKGGVGKSTIATQLAMQFWREGFRVGLLDIDLCGPSIPTILGGYKFDVLKCEGGWQPVYVDKEENNSSDPRFAVMSIGFFLAKPTDSVVWRGPKKSAMVDTLLNQVRWGALDYLIIDTPPGTSDEKITLASALKKQCTSQALAGALFVTTPQRVAISDVRKDVTFYQKVLIPIIGLIENMSGTTCPNCQHMDRIFNIGGGEALADAREIPFLGALPLMPELTRVMDMKAPFLEKATMPIEPTLKLIFDKIRESVSK